MPFATGEFENSAAEDTCFDPFRSNAITSRSESGRSAEAFIAVRTTVSTARPFIAL